MFEGLRLWRAKYVIMLDGRPGAGKDTLLKIMKGKGFDPERKATPQAVEKETIKLGKKQSRIYNTSGREGAVNKKSIERDRLPKRKTLWIEVFDMGEYDKPNSVTHISLANEIQARYNEAQERGFEFLAFGTHLDANKDKQERIENDLEKKGIRVVCYELSKNPKEDIIELIKALYN